MEKEERSPQPHVEFRVTENRTYTDDNGVEHDTDLEYKIDVEIDTGDFTDVLAQIRDIVFGVNKKD